MSKTTIALILFLFLAVGILLFVQINTKQTSFVTSLTHFSRVTAAPPDTELSFETNELTVKAGQTESESILIHNPNPHPSIIQVEIAYDPTLMTITGITPGAFFTEPTIVLQNIDPNSGRISYALRCTINDCVNKDSPIVATVTFQINPSILSNKTTLTFLPKTVVRSSIGRDLLQKTSGLQVTITQSLYPVSSQSAIASPGAQRKY